MKSFDEWYLENDFKPKPIKDSNGKYKDSCVYMMFLSWQAAQEVQRESDADLIMLQSESPYWPDLIRNNKAV